MKPLFTTATEKAITSDHTQPTMLIETLSRLLRPLARLCLAIGVTFAAVEDALKQAFVQEADALQPDAPMYGKVSRISTATGICRREVTRLIRPRTHTRPTKPSLASEVFTRWASDISLRDQSGAPGMLKRQGPAPSFEALAQSITRDVHPRKMLDELVRLGMARFDEDSDSVALIRKNFIPRSDSQQMFSFLGDNVGDHFEATVANVLQDGTQHFEQAVFADELSVESVKALNPLIAAHWQALRDAVVPALAGLIEADRLAGRPQDQRVRIGLYTYFETAPNIEDKSGNTSKRSVTR